MVADGPETRSAAGSDSTALACHCCTAKHFPLDLVYSVLDVLCDDGPTLASCTLVAHNWVMPAKRHLLRKITLQHRDKLQTFHRSLVSLDGVFLPNVVQELCIGRFNGYAAAVQLDLHKLCTILSYLPNVTNLEIVGVSLTPVKDQCELAEVDAWEPRQMRSVTFHDVAFHSYDYFDKTLAQVRRCSCAGIMFQEVWRFLSLFSSVKSMYVNCGRWVIGEDHAKLHDIESFCELQDLPSLTKFKAQILGLVDMSFVEIFRRTGTLETLEKLVISPTDDQQCIAAQSLIDHTPSLTHVICISPQSAIRRVEVLQPKFDFSQCPKLESVYYQTKVMAALTMQASQSHVRPWLQSCATCPTTIRSVRLAFDLSNCHNGLRLGESVEELVEPDILFNFAGYEWSRLDSILSSRPLLDRVEFQLQFNPSDKFRDDIWLRSGCEGFVRLFLPILHHRGVLRFSTELLRE